MIKTWKNTATRQFAETGKNKFRGMDIEIAKRRLQALHGAVSLEGLGQFKSFRFHKLDRERKGYWSITINGPWRLVFKFENGHAYDVEIVDYH